MRPAWRADSCDVPDVPNVKVWKPNIVTRYRKALPLHYLTRTQVYDYAMRNHGVPYYYFYGNHYLIITIHTCTYNLCRGGNSMLIIGNYGLGVESNTTSGCITFISFYKMWIRGDYMFRPS